jgi:hypothetical protein
MFHRWHLGNDIVDLTDPRHTGKAGDERFLRRVFSEREQEDILQAPDPDRALWMRWAGKEAAFKTISKSEGTPPTFAHRLFRVTVFPYQEPPGKDGGGNLEPPMTRFGQVHHGDVLLPLRVESVGTALHALTWTPPPTEQVPPFSWGSELFSPWPGEWKAALEPAFSPREWECISHQASALARLAARRALALSLGVPEGELEIGCAPGRPGRRIPKVFLEGKDTEVDLTLSHHGRLLAWAFLI